MVKVLAPRLAHTDSEESPLYLLCRDPQLKRCTKTMGQNHGVAKSLLERQEFQTSNVKTVQSQMKTKLFVIFMKR
jgi:hypothetical protein